MWFVEMISHTELERAIFAAGHSIWIGGALGLLLWVCLRLVPARYAGVRYAMTLGALGLLVVSLPATYTVMSRAGGAVPAAVTISSQIQSSAVPISVTPALQVAQVAQDRPAATGGQTDWVQIAVLIWAVGFVAMLIRMAVQLRGTRRLLDGAQDASQTVAGQTVGRLLERLQWRARLRVLLTPQLNSPAVLGIFRPVLLIPPAIACELTPQQLESILLHELAHIRRYDYMVNIGQLLIEAVLFFNPAVWLISRQVRIEREACCDAFAARITGEPLRYAEVLGAVMGRLGGVSAAMAVTGEGSGHALDRVRRLLVPGYRPGLRLSGPVLTGMVIAGLLLFVCLWEATGIAVAAGASATANVGQADASRDEIIRILRSARGVADQVESGRGLAEVVETRTGKTTTRKLAFWFRGSATRVDSQGSADGTVAVRKWYDDGTESVALNASGDIVIARSGSLSGYRECGSDFHPTAMAALQPRGPMNFDGVIDNILSAKSDARITTTSDGRIRIVTSFRYPEGESKSSKLTVEIDPKQDMRVVLYDSEQLNEPWPGVVHRLRMDVTWAQKDGVWYVAEAHRTFAGNMGPVEGHVRPTQTADLRVRIKEYEPKVPVADVMFAIEGLGAAAGTPVYDQVKGTTYRYLQPDDVLQVGIGSAATAPAKVSTEPGAVTKPVGAATRPTTAPVTADDPLERRLPLVQFSETSLQDAVDYLRDKAELNIIVDWPRLQQIGITPESKVWARLRGVPVSKCLDELCRQQIGSGLDHAAWVFDRGVVTITTRSSLSHPVTKVYDLTDIVGTLDPSGQREAAKWLDDVSALIVSTVETDTWEEAGGQGTVRPFKKNNCLIISQTEDVHAKVEALLSRLRERSALSVDVRLLTVELPVAQLPARMRDTIDKTPGWYPTDEEVADLIKTARANRQDAVMSAPRMMIMNGGTGRVDIWTDVNYLGNVKATTQPGTAPVYQPEISTTRTGMGVAVSAFVSHDRKYVRLQLKHETKRLLSMGETPYKPVADAKESFTIQQPVTNDTSSETDVSVESGKTVCLREQVITPPDGKGEPRVLLLMATPRISIDATMLAKLSQGVVQDGK